MRIGLRLRQPVSQSLEPVARMPWSQSQTGCKASEPEMGAVRGHEPEMGQLERRVAAENGPIRRDQARGGAPDVKQFVIRIRQADRATRSDVVCGLGPLPAFRSH